MDEKTSSKGVIINGEPGSGKTAAILQLVESSCFGRGQSGLAGKLKIITIITHHGKAIADYCIEYLEDKNDLFIQKRLMCEGSR